jgi:hypothetical protein
MCAKNDTQSRVTFCLGCNMRGVQWARAVLCRASQQLQPKAVEPPTLTSLCSCLACCPSTATRLCCLDGVACCCARLLVPVDELVVLRQGLLGSSWCICACRKCAHQTSRA